MLKLNTENSVFYKIPTKTISEFPFKIFSQSEEYFRGRFEEWAGRQQLLRFLSVPINFSFFLCLSPFYLKVTTTLGNDMPKVTVSAKSWLPQKITCALLTILDLLWMIQFVRKSFPANPKNPSHHINMVTTLISQLFKCVMLKKLWANKKDFAKIANYILTSRIPVLQSGWLVKFGNVLIYSLLVMYTILGLMYIDWVGGFTEFSVTEAARPTIGSNWWSGMVASGKHNFFLNNSTSIAAPTMLSPWMDNFIGVLSTAGLLHRFQIKYSLIPKKCLLEIVIMF